MARLSPKSTLSPAAGLLLFAALAAHNLTLPGLHSDEAQEAGIQAQQILSDQPVSAFRDATISVAGRQWPLMVQDYIGTLNIALVLPFFALLGASVFSLRLMAVSVGLVTIALTCALARQVSGRRAGILSALLLAVQPSFLFWNRQGVFVTSVTAALAAACLWALAAWLRRPNRWRRLALASFLAGLGIYAKLLFLWILGGVALMVLVLLASDRALDMRRRALEAKSRIGLYALRFTLCSLLPFLVGLAPLALYNLQTGGTLASVSGNLATSFYGVDNLDVARNLATRWDQLRAVLAGRDHLWYLGGSFGNPATEWLVGLAVAVIAARAALRRPGSTLALAAALIVALAWLQSVFTVSGLFPTHFAILVPFIVMLIALGLDGLLAELGRTPPEIHARSGPGRVAAIALVVAAIGGSLLRDGWVDIQYHRTLGRTGGLNVHSDAVYALAEYLDGLPGRGPVVALDWGYAPAVRFLTADRVAPDEVFGYSWEADAEFEGRLAPSLESRDALFVTHWPQETIFPRQEAFGAALAARGLQTRTLKTFSRRDGAPIFDVIRVERLP